MLCIVSVCHSTKVKEAVLPVFFETDISISVLSLTTVSISPTGLHQRYSSHAWTELLQPWNLACGTLFRSSCAIQTLSADCSDDIWRDVFFRNHEHSTLWLLICWHHKKQLLAYSPHISCLDYGSIIFAMRHLMQCTILLSQFGLSVHSSVRPSVCQMHVLWQNQTMDCGYFDTTRNGNHSNLRMLNRYWLTSYRF